MNWGFDRTLAAKSLLTGGVAGAALPPALGVFDWVGVAVGHWHAVGPGGYDKGGRRLYTCVSRCGVVARIRDRELAAGYPLTCEACQPGTACPPAARILPDAEVAKNWGKWPVELIGSNLKGREAPEDWARYGEPAVRAVLAAAGHPADWGWKVFVRDCSRGCGGQRHPVRVRNSNTAARRLELVVCPAGSRYRFFVDLSTGRQCDFPAVLAALAAAAERPPDPEPDPPPAAATPAAATPAAVAAAVGAQTDRLVRMRDGLDRLIQASGDIAAAEAMLAEAREALAAAELAADAEGRALEAAAAAARAAADAAAALARREAELDAELAATRRDRAAAEAAARERAAERDAAHGRLRPLAGRVTEAAAAVQDAEKLHAERAAVVAGAGDLSVLLAAVERLAG